MTSYYDVFGHFSEVPGRHGRSVQEEEVSLRRHSSQEGMEDEAEDEVWRVIVDSF